MRTRKNRRELTRRRCSLCGTLAAALLAGCASQAPPPAVAIDAGDPVKAAYVVLGPGGAAVARVITTSAACPELEVDGARVAMVVRAAPATEALRPTLSAPSDSKPSAFPVTTCEAHLAADVQRVGVGGHALPAPRRDPQRIVVIGDTGCRMKISDDAFQACNDPADWPFAQVAAAAAAMRPDLVIHVGDYHYRENACPPGNRGCAGSPWGYGWDTWDADLFAPARALLAAAPWIVVRGNHESCSRAGQGWWRFLDPRPLVRERDCNDPANDGIGDFSDPYAVPIAADTQLIVFDSSKVGTRALAITDPMYRIYSAQMRDAFALGRNVDYNFFMNHHPILGLAPDPTQQPTSVYPGNEALQSVLQPIQGRQLFPTNVQALIAGHYHLFEMVSFATPQPTQLISGNAGSWLYPPLPHQLARSAQPASGAVIESIVSTSEYGFMTIERGTGGTWRVDAWDRRGLPFTHCTLRGAKTHCVPETLP
ncbi:MAG TPA: metallophosphoesterase [Casimicrobiaceae bacterium]|nr:metallophosphoesterase [Casimicrobiaceae bacterium]